MQFTTVAAGSRTASSSGAPGRPGRRSAVPEEATCPFRDAEHPPGFVRHVKNRFTHPDGSQHAPTATPCLPLTHVGKALRRHREPKRAGGASAA